MTRVYFLIIAVFVFVHTSYSQLVNVEINTDKEFQTMTGFGASLAYYESWLTAHPNRAEIYEVIFNELSLDILRLRNAHGYDAGMLDRAKQFTNAAALNLGYPIDVMVSSWGPPAWLKSNGDRKNGGTLTYSVIDGKVEFNYSGFANWWNESLDAYNAYGIYPKYISIQNEPDFSASWESCLLRPSEVVNSGDTIAGYNKAFDAVYDTLMKRENQPLFVGPECVGIGYNAVENYINPLDLSKLHAIAHHLYHGAEGGSVTDDPFTSTNYDKVGKFHPEIPHFQTEYSRKGWFTLAGMMFQSLAVENVTAFLYWDLIWSEGGLVNLHFPWDRSKWENSKGYNRTKDFYVFKHFSAFIHPGWKRVDNSTLSEQVKTASFISNSGDSAAFVVINRSLTDTAKIKISVPGFSINEATVYSTTEGNNFVESNYFNDTLLLVPPKSLHTADLRLSPINTNLKNYKRAKGINTLEVKNYPNPFQNSTRFTFTSTNPEEFIFELYDVSGKKARIKNLGYFPAGEHNFIIHKNGLNSGIYFYRLRNASGKCGTGKLMIK